MLTCVPRIAGNPPHRTVIRTARPPRRVAPPLVLSPAAPPLSRPQLVELKNGVTFNGHLVDCDNFMNVTLRDVYQTSADGERFWKMKEMFIKGNVVRARAARLPGAGCGVRRTLRAPRAPAPSSLDRPPLHSHARSSTSA